MTGLSFLPQGLVLRGPGPAIPTGFTARRLAETDAYRITGGTPEARLALAEARAATHAVWVWRYDESTGVEATAHLGSDGSWSEETVRADQDETFVRLAEDHETPVATLHRHVWRHWPISHLVRTLGLDTRTWLIRPTGRLAVGGAVPEDVDPPWIHCIMDLPADLHDAIRARARESESSFSRALADALAGTPVDPGRLPAAVDDRTEVLYLPRPLHAAITETATTHGVHRAQVVAARWRSI